MFIFIDIAFAAVINWDSLQDLTKRDQLKFVDSLKLYIKGGHGGNGLPKYGGVGGQGGCVAFEAVEKSQLKNVARK